MAAQSRQEITYYANIIGKSISLVNKVIREENAARVINGKPHYHSATERLLDGRFPPYVEHDVF